MLSFLDPLRNLDLLAIFLRMALACLCGAVIGMERSAKNRPAGFRTHILVCMAATVAATTGLYLTLELQLPSDISRISGQVISGLGFIGAGTIVVTKKMSIKGLTTAAGLWATGIIGLAIGSGYYEIAVVGTALVLLAETWFAVLGGHIAKDPQYVLEILYNEKTSLDNVLRFCKDNRMSIVNLRIKTLEDSFDAREDAVDAKYAAEVSLRGTTSCDTLLSQIQQMQGIVSAMSL